MAWRPSKIELELRSHAGPRSFPPRLFLVGGFIETHGNQLLNGRGAGRLTRLCMAPCVNFCQQLFADAHFKAFVVNHIKHLRHLGSSFLRAGLLPRLARDERNFTPLRIIRPERAAIAGANGLVAALAEAAAAEGLTTTRATIREAVANGAAALRPILKSLAARTGDAKPPTLVVTIDQAEELFRAEGAPERNMRVV
jgi:hypothetical protein